MGQPSIWGSPARESQLQGSNTELQGLLKMLQMSSVNSHPPLIKSTIPVSIPWNWLWIGVVAVMVPVFKNSFRCQHWLCKKSSSLS